MTHHSVMPSSLRIKILKIGKFSDFSFDFDYSCNTDIFRDVISLIINQCEPRFPKGASSGHKVSASRAAQASEPRLLLISVKDNQTVNAKIYPFRTYQFSDSTHSISYRLKFINCVALPAIHIRWICWW